jgi:hypothetical protein
MDVKNDTPVRSREEIKRSLLRRVWNGSTQRTGAEMRAAIHSAVQRGQDMSLEHSLELAQIDDSEPRAVRALNLLEKRNGSDRRFTDATRKPSGPTFH